MAWKLILGSKEKEVKTPRTQEVRNETIYSIVTNDVYQLCLGEYTKDDKGDLEIKGERYKKFNPSYTYNKNYNDVVAKVLKDESFNPVEDIESPKDVIVLYLKLISMGKELFEKDIQEFIMD